MIQIPHEEEVRKVTHLSQREVQREIKAARSVLNQVLPCANGLVIRMEELAHGELSSHRAVVQERYEEIRRNSLGFFDSTTLSIDDLRQPIASIEKTPKDMTSFTVNRHQIATEGEARVESM